MEGGMGFGESASVIILWAGTARGQRGQPGWVFAMRVSGSFMAQ